MDQRMSNALDAWITREPDEDLCPECGDPFDPTGVHWVEKREYRDAYAVIHSTATLDCGHKVHEYDLEGTAGLSETQLSDPDN